VATGSATPLSIAIGGFVLDRVTDAGYHDASPRVVFLIGAIAFVVAAVALRRVVEPRRKPLAPATVPAGATAG
jgi:hypothetical protein